RYLRDPDSALVRKPRPQRPSKLDPYKEYIMQRLAEGVDNCVVLLREIRQQGYTGGYTILKDFVRPFRRRAVAGPRCGSKPPQVSRRRSTSARLRTARPTARSGERGLS